MNPVAEAMKRMRAAFPRQPFGDVAVRVYVEQLGDLDDELVFDAVSRLLNTSTYMPTIADIRREVAEMVLQLPTPEQAWDVACEYASSEEGTLRREDVPEVIRHSIRAVGGPWALRTSTNQETLRAQFRKDYEGRCARMVKNAAVGRPVTIETLKAAQVASLNARRVAEIPATTRMRPRGDTGPVVR